MRPGIERWAVPLCSPHDCQPFVSLSLAEAEPGEAFGVVCKHARVSPVEKRTGACTRFLRLCRRDYVNLEAFGSLINSTIQHVFRVRFRGLIHIAPAV